MGAVSVFVQKHPPTKKQFFPEKKTASKSPHRLFRGSASYALHSLRNASSAATAPCPFLHVSSYAVKFYLVQEKSPGRSGRTCIFALTAFQNLLKKGSILSHPLKMD